MSTIFYYYFIIVLIVIIAGFIITSNGIAKNGIYTTGYSGPKPASWIFGVVWIILYLMIIASGYIAEQAASSVEEKNLLRMLWTVQIALNFAWTYCYFGERNTRLALIVILLLLLFIVLFMVAAAQVSMTAFWLFMPYLIWVLFATYLTLQLDRAAQQKVTLQD